MKKGPLIEVSTMPNVGFLDQSGFYPTLPLNVCTCIILMVTGELSYENLEMRQMMLELGLSEIYDPNNMVLAQSIDNSRS